MRKCGHTSTRTRRNSWRCVCGSPITRYAPCVSGSWPSLISSLRPSSAHLPFLLFCLSSIPLLSSPPSSSPFLLWPHLSGASPSGKDTDRCLQDENGSISTRRSFLRCSCDAPQVIIPFLLLSPSLLSNYYIFPETTVSYLSACVDGIPIDRQREKARRSQDKYKTNAALHALATASPVYASSTALCMSLTQVRLLPPFFVDAHQSGSNRDGDRPRGEGATADAPQPEHC